LIAQGCQVQLKVSADTITRHLYVQGHSHANTSYVKKNNDGYPL